MIITLIVAMTADGLIGRGGALPWHLPADLRRFRKLTMGKPIVMGRRTFESLGRPLDGRLNVVLSRREDFRPHGCRVASTLAEALGIAREDLAITGGDEVLILGGAAAFREALPLADRMHRTLVEGVFEGDTFFPLDAFRSEQWRLVEDVPRPADDRNPHPHRFQVFERRR